MFNHENFNCCVLNFTVAIILYEIVSKLYSPDNDSKINCDFICHSSGIEGQWLSYLGKLSKLMFSVEKPKDKEVTP